MSAGNDPVRGVVSAALVAAALVACGPGFVGEAIRGEAPTAREALGEPAEEVSCRDVKHARPLVVDWPSQDRLDLELAMKNGVAIVQYDCDGIRLLPSCRLSGDYRFVGVSRKEDVIQLKGADELAANLPLSAATLSAEMTRESSLDLALVIVGKKTTTVAGASTLMLDGACEGASHLVQAATIGAFAMDRGSAGKARAVAELFGAGARGGSESQKSAGTKDGDLAACRQSTSDDAEPRDQCQAAVRLELAPLTEGAVVANKAENQGADAVEAACPEGMVSQGDKCTDAKVSPYTCSPFNVAECTAECDAGSLTSCHHLANLFAHGRGVKRDDRRAVDLSYRACKGGVYEACGLFSIMADTCTISKLGNCHRDEREALLRAGCEAGHGRSCHRAATLGSRKLAEVAPLYARGCDLGYSHSCTVLGMGLVGGRGIARDVARGVAVLERSCDGRAMASCQMLARYYEKGTDGIAPDAGRAAELRAKLCGLGAIRSCLTSGDAFEKAPPGVSKDLRRAEKLFRIACNMPRQSKTVGEACSRYASLLRRFRKRSVEQERELLAADANACAYAGLDCMRVAANARSRAFDQDRDACIQDDSEACLRLERRMLEAGCEKGRDDDACRKLGERDPLLLRAILRRRCAKAKDSDGPECAALEKMTAPRAQP